MKQKLTPLLLFILFKNADAQQNKNDITGDWKGTSICQVKSSPCHDEIVVYHIFKKEKGYEILANKIVNSKEEEMGTLPATYNQSEKKLTAILKGKPLWNFTINGDEMKGTLVLEDGTLYRVVDLQRMK